MEDLTTRVIAAMSHRRAERMARLMVQAAMNSHDKDRWHEMAETAFAASHEGRTQAAHVKILAWTQQRQCGESGEHLWNPPDPDEIVEALAEAYGITVEVEA